MNIKDQEEILSENDLKNLFTQAIEANSPKEIVKKFIQAKIYKDCNYTINGAEIEKQYFVGRGKLQITIDNLGTNCHLKSNFYDGVVKFGHIGNVYNKYTNIFYIKNDKYTITWNGFIYKIINKKEDLIVKVNISTMLEWLRELLLKKGFINREDVINCNFIKLIENNIEFNEALKIQREMYSC